MTESTASERTCDRRTYLKTLVAAGATASLAGCVDLGTFESSISAYEPSWASDSGYTTADYRRHERASGQDDRWSIGVRLVSHAVTYSHDGSAAVDGEPTSGAGIFTTPTKGGLIKQFNPFVGQSTDELLQGDAARLLLDGLGINVGNNWSWETGPTVESLDAGSVRQKKGRSFPRASPCNRSSRWGLDRPSSVANTAIG